jgi:hypothetical protein
LGIIVDFAVKRHHYVAGWVERRLPSRIGQIANREAAMTEMGVVGAFYALTVWPSVCKRTRHSPNDLWIQAAIGKADIACYPTHGVPLSSNSALGSA